MKLDRRILIAFLTVLTATGAALGQSVPLYRMPPGAALRVAPIETAPGLADVRGLAPGQRLQAAEVGAVDQLEAMRRWNREGRLPARNGFVRPLPSPLQARFGDAPTLALRGASVGTVEAVDDQGVTWATRIEVEGAWRVRLRLDDVRLPAGTRLWVSGANGETVAFGLDLLDPRGSLWTPSVGGSVVTLELLVPAGEERQESGFAIEELLQLFPPDALVERVTDPSCLVDARCVNAGTFPVIDDVRAGVAHLQFGGFVCSGGLLGNTDLDFTPYLLTANHCFDSQVDASSLEVFWDYFTDDCEEPFGDSAFWPDLATLPRTNGSTLLATGASSDYTLVRLDDLPPNRAFLGWKTDPVSDGQIVHRVSHPAPFFEVYPQTYTQYRVDEQVPECIGAPRPSFIHTKNILSGTFGGSSGSPLLNDVGQVLGQLTGACGPDGENGCDFRNTEVDGAFAASFPALQPFLAPGPCVSGPNVLCIDDAPADGRFRVTMTFDSPSQGVSGTAQAIETDAVGVTRGGILAFNNPANPEVLIKVLNGCPLNGHYWVFFAATTDLGFEIEVRDTTTQEVRTYTNADGNPASLIQDFEAFAGCTP